MEFKEFKGLLQEHVSKIMEDQTILFVTDVNKDELWDTYLESFPEGTNLIFRERREYDCSCCRQFIKTFGNVVAIKDNAIISIWDFEVGSPTFQPVINTLSALVKAAPIRDAFISKESAIGTDKNHEQLENGTVHTWEHFRVNLPKQFVTRSTKSEASLMAEKRDVKNVFKRSLEEISKDAIETVLDLTAQKSLYKGDEWESVLTRFLALHTEYHKLQTDGKDAFCWIKSVEVGGVIGKIRNHSIGVLLVDITNGVDLNEAVRKYEAIIAPTNYKRPKAIFTKKMIEQAQQTLIDMGLIDSLGRRHSTLEDITVNNILFANKDAAKRIQGDVFAELQKDVAVNPKAFDKIEEVPIDRFLEQILPTTTNIEALFENRHMPNLVSLISPSANGDKHLFKWHNNFSWAYNGNITDSIKEHVKAAGGNVDGVFRFSPLWNKDGDNQNDFDAHCQEPNGNHIWFQNKGRKHPSTGMLDVDIINPGPNVAVENITWTDFNKMQEGIYSFWVHCYSHNGGRSGFSAEIEYDGTIYSYEYNKELRQDENVPVATIQFSKINGIKFIESLPSSTSTKTAWNIQTNQFHPVSVCMFSPNYWDDQVGIGNKHCFFILNECRNEDRPNGFFNEFLHEELMPHKRVFEALGSKMRVEPSDNQLSGLGFSSTIRNSIVLKVEGHIDRKIKVAF